MTNEDIAVKLAEHNKEIGSLKYRVNDLEEQTNIIQELALSVKELAINMQSMIKEQERAAKVQEKATQRIDDLEKRPAKKWDTLTSVIITAIVSGVIGYILSGIF